MTARGDDYSMALDFYGILESVENTGFDLGDQGLLSVHRELTSKLHMP